MPRFEEHQDSVWYFKRGEFKNYIQGIADKSMLVPDAFATFRELKCLPKKFKQMTVQQVATILDSLVNFMKDSGRCNLNPNTSCHIKKKIGKWN